VSWTGDSSLKQQLSEVGDVGEEKARARMALREDYEHSKVSAAEL
jgi:hypothetical protein